MDIWVSDVKYGTHNYIWWLLMQILYNFWCETQITNFWSMEGFQYDNNNNAGVYAAEV